MRGNRGNGGNTVEEKEKEGLADEQKEEEEQ